MNKSNAIILSPLAVSVPVWVCFADVAGTTSRNAFSIGCCTAEISPARGTGSERRQHVMEE